MSEIRSALPPLVLVTGASGYVGLHMVKALLDQNYRVRGTVRSLRNTKKIEPLKNIAPENLRFPLQLVEADLLQDEGWNEAVFDCDYVIHVAGPNPKKSPCKESEVKPPTSEGTLRLLRACAVEARQKKLKRVVLTGSILAVHGETDVDESKVHTENDWTDPCAPSTSTFAKCKTLTEKLAWDFVNGLREEEKFELSVVNGGMAFGPLLSDSHSASHEILVFLMDRKRMPMLPELRICLCDVRDLAKAHLRAMVSPEAAGKRHIVVTANLWAKEIASIAHEAFADMGYNISQTYAPHSVFRLAGAMDKGLKALADSLGKSYRFDSSRTRSILGMELRDMRCTIVETVHSLIQRGIVKKSKEYREPQITKRNSTASLY